MASVSLVPVKPCARRLSAISLLFSANSPRVTISPFTLAAISSTTRTGCVWAEAAPTAAPQSTTNFQNIMRSPSYQLPAVTGAARPILRDQQYPCHIRQPHVPHSFPSPPWAGSVRQFRFGTLGRRRVKENGEDVPRVFSRSTRTVARRNQGDGVAEKHSPDCPLSCRPPRTLRPQSERMCPRSEEHTSELQSPCNLVCRLLLEK